jgi:hypothetical protein
MAKDWCDLPSIKPGTVGITPGAGKVGPAREPLSKSSEKEDDDTGRLSRYCNPPGFIGLHGEAAGKNTWEETGGMREVKRGVQKFPDGLKGEPLK